MIPSTTSDDNIAIINGQYIQALNNIQASYPGVVDTERLIKPTSSVVKLPGDEDSRWAGQCVVYVKYALRKLAPELSGNAIAWKDYINSEKPIVGSVVVMKVGKWGHLGIVVKVNDNSVVVRSRNWRGLWVISDDEFELSDERLLGYITF